MTRSLVREDEEKEVEEPEQASTDAIVQQKITEKTASVKSMLSGLGGWLSRRKLPEPWKKGIAKEWSYIMTGDKNSQSKKRQKFTAGPIRSFAKKEKRKGKLD